MKEELSYRVEWRLVHAGNANLFWEASSGSGAWSTKLALESVGLVSRLHKVKNEYTSSLDAGLCVTDSLMKTNEGRKHRETSITFDQVQKKASYLERDTTKNSVVDSHEIDLPGCVHDLVGALYKLRTLKLEPGESAQIPVSDGKKAVSVRVEAQERESIRTQTGSHRTLRFEAHVFNNALFRRRGRLFIWLTEDDQKVPVQIRVRLPFYIGTVTLELIS